MTNNIKDIIIPANGRSKLTCGCKGTVARIKDDDAEGVVIECLNCHCIVRGVDIEETEERFRRATRADVVEKVKSLENRLDAIKELFCQGYHCEEIDDECVGMKSFIERLKEQVFTEDE